MSRFTLRNLYLLPLLCCPSVVFAQFDQCSIEVPSAVHGSQIWLQLGHPLNMTIERLGRLQDSAGAKLVTLAYQGWQQGKTELQISNDVAALCKTFSTAELEADIVDDPWPVPRTVCGDVSESVLNAMNDSGSTAAATVLFQLKGEEAAPNMLPVVEQAVALKRQNASDTQILEQLYSGCAKKSAAEKAALGKEFYVE
ncbi:hypothetical protein [Rheinheimera fenheensis]|uniref:hypothetical protein n=1 Tax=Rheinheimera fenheensis TaxID=3152295 RepID=UPI003260FECE